MAFLVILIVGTGDPLVLDLELLLCSHRVATEAINGAKLTETT